MEKFEMVVGQSFFNKEVTVVAVTFAGTGAAGTVAARKWFETQPGGRPATVKPVQPHMTAEEVAGRMKERFETYYERYEEGVKPFKIKAGVQRVKGEF